MSHVTWSSAISIRSAILSQLKTKAEGRGEGERGRERDAADCGTNNTLFTGCQSILEKVQRTRHPVINPSDRIENHIKYIFRLSLKIALSKLSKRPLFPH